MLQWRRDYLFFVHLLTRGPACLLTRGRACLFGEKSSCVNVKDVLSNPQYC